MSKTPMISLEPGELGAFEAALSKKLPHLLEEFDKKYVHVKFRQNNSCPRCGAVIPSAERRTHKQFHRGLSLVLFVLGGGISEVRDGVDDLRGDIATLGPP